MLSCIRCLEDLKADDNGVWLHEGKPRCQYVVKFDELHREVVSVTPVDSEERVNRESLFNRLYHRHKTTLFSAKDFICTRLFEASCTLCICAIFENGNEVPVVLPPHGNAKRSTSHCTQCSTLKESKAKQKVVVSKLHQEMGGNIKCQ